MTTLLSKGPNKMYLNKEQYHKIKDVWKDFSKTKRAKSWQHLLYLLITNRSVNDAFLPLQLENKIISAGGDQYHALDEAAAYMREQLRAADLGRVGLGKSYGAVHIGSIEPFEVYLDGQYSFPKDIKGDFNIRISPDTAQKLCELSIEEMLELKREAPYQELVDAVASQDQTSVADLV